jgi:DNA-binding NarL/FixJ family response regulator
MPYIRLFLVDDHPIVRAGLQAILATESDFVLVGTASTAAEATAAIRSHLPDVALVDLRLDAGSGFQIISDVVAAKLSTQILVLTTYDDEMSVTRALDAGAKGYLLKDVPREQLFAAIRLVARGERILSAQVQNRLSTRKSPGTEILSPRELEVLHWLARGESNRTIAKRLFISEATVKTHLLHVFAKLGQSQRTGAVTEALRRGWIHLDGADGSSKG